MRNVYNDYYIVFSVSRFLIKIENDHRRHDDTFIVPFEASPPALAKEPLRDLQKKAHQIATNVIIDTM